MESLKEEPEDKLKFHEFEVKFRVEESLLIDWKQLVSKQEGVQVFKYVESDDIYFSKDDTFLRYRFSTIKKDKRAELTLKSKLNDSNNIIRKEVNLRIDGNAGDTVTEFASCLGFQYNFRISKYVHLYEFDDVVLPFYTVIDSNGKRDSFIEIEINEEKVSELTEEQCWNIIKKYEQILAPLGVTPQKRLRLSLFEMYRK